MLADRFGAFAASLRYDDLPKPVAEALKLRLLDLLGAAVSGIRAGSWQPFAAEPAPGDARVWALGTTGAARDAAFLNSFVSHATYMEDGSRFSGGHPASVVIPAALAVLESQADRSGARLLASVAVGYEVFLRLGRSVYPEIVRRGYQSTAALGAVAAAASAASAAGLSGPQSAHAIAIAGSLGFGLKHALRCSSSQPVQVARACEGGVLAALAAGKGAVGAADLLEAGLLEVVGGAADRTALTDTLGAQFSVAETYLKLHGGCRGNHAPIDLAADLLARAGRAANQISAIRIWVDSVTDAADIDAPQSSGQAQFSARFAVATYLLWGDALPERYVAAQLADPRQRALMDCIEVHADPRLDLHYPERRGARMIMTFEDGCAIEGEIANARGEPEQPLSTAEVVEKFMRLASPALGDRAAELRDLALGSDSLTDVSVLGRMMAEAGRTVPLDVSVEGRNRKEVLT